MLITIIIIIKNKSDENNKVWDIVVNCTFGFFVYPNLTKITKGKKFELSLNIRNAESLNTIIVHRKCVIRAYSRKALYLSP